MKIKSAKRKASLNKAKKTKSHGDLIIVKTEPEPQLEEETITNPAHTNGVDPNIQIKEEPDLDVHNISEEHNGSSLSNCSATNKDSSAVTPKSELSHAHIGQRNVNIKEELESDPELEYDFHKGVVKMESESHVKEESGDEQEEVAENIQEDVDVRGEREDCKESSSQFFPCPHCTVSFTDQDFLEKHVKWVHQKQYLAMLKKSSSHCKVDPAPEHNCSICGCTFPSQIQLGVHLRETHPSSPPRRLYPCPTCARSFQYLKNLKNHCQRWHNMAVVTRGGHLSCADCGKSFKTTWGQGPHLCNKPEEDKKPDDRPVCLDTRVQCLECGKRLGTPQSLAYHMHIHTGDRPFACKDCGKSFTEPSGWRQHMLIHTGEKPYKCQVCGKAFLRSHHLKYHLTTHSGKKEYSCSECGKQFGVKSSLNLHLKSHSGEKPFNCTVCGKNFNTRRNLRIHTKLHTNEKVHQCGDCGLKIGDLGALKIHLRTHTGERPYHCTVCGNRFIRLAHLRNHQRTHTGERPYKCTECSKSFVQSGDLVKHKRTHSGEKPFECLHCHRCYTSSGDLSKHMRSHNNLRPHTCQECGKGFRLSGHLKTHMLTHTGEKPYSCPNCLRRFARSHHLSGHMSRCR